MSVKIKICGIKTNEALDAAIAARADYFGLVFFPVSPRHVSLDQGRALVERAAGRIKAVALLVDPEADEALRVAETVKPDLIQLHGQESPELVARIARLTGLPVIKAVAVASQRDVEQALIFDDVAELVLFDAATRQKGADSLPGGMGNPFDWRLLSNVKDERLFVLSGGLNPDNVAQAIKLTRAPIVDVSSGVEHNRGDKDPELIRRFVSAARAAPQLG